MKVIAIWGTTKYRSLPDYDKLIHQHEILILHDFMNMEVSEKFMLHIGSLDSNMLPIRKSIDIAVVVLKTEYCMEFVKHSLSP